MTVPLCSSFAERHH